MTDGDPSRGRRIFRRRQRGDGDEPAPAGQPGKDPFADEPPELRSALSAAHADAERQREEEAAAVQLARERAIAEEAERTEREAYEAELATRTLWTDSHCHLQYAPDDEETAAIIERAAAAGVRRMICVGTDAASSRRAIEVAGRNSRSGALTLDIYATVGLHPHDAKEGLDEIRDLLDSVLATGREEARVVAIGECGLDYHYEHSPRGAQRTAFASQIALANEHDLTLVVHSRDAFDDTFSILATEGVPKRTVFHCFTGGPADAERCLAIDGYLSFSGITSFANAEPVRESVRLCPAGKLLIETDSPYLTPVPNRGKPNEPQYVTLVGEAVARERGVEPGDIAWLTSANAVTAFSLGEG